MKVVGSEGIEEESFKKFLKLLERTLTLNNSFYTLREVERC
jgi:hypothetical protein